MVQQFRLSVLDQSPIAEGFTASDALRNTLDLARAADRLGYHRYWLAEHHGTPSLACNSPEVLIGPVAAATSRIRVGSGGIMLPHYSALKVAENFTMLSSLYPGRIDLGIGRAAGTSSTVARALQRDPRQSAPDDFPEQLAELLGYFGYGANAAERVHFDRPEPWLLGSSPQSAIWAAELGLPYVFADFINPEGEAISAFYRQNFRPSAISQSPNLGVAIWAIAADTEEEAEALASSIRMMMTLLYRGRLIPVPAVDRAQEFLRQDDLQTGFPPARRRIITGTAASVRQKLERLARDYNADEVLVVNILHDHEKRVHSYELLADAFNLQPHGALSHVAAASLS